MGEEQTPPEAPVEPAAPVVAQVDLGAEAVDQTAVQVPTTERLLGFSMQRHVDPQDDTPKWQSFVVATEHRTIPVEPGSVGEAPFATFCDDVRAMLETPEGIKVVGKMRALMRSKPLKIKTVPQ